MSNSYYHTVPEWVREIVGPVLTPQLKFLYRIYRIARDLFPRVIHLILWQKSNGTRQNLLLVGIGDSAPFLVSRFPSETVDATIQSRTAIYSLQGPSYFAEGMMVIEGDRCFSESMQKRGMLAVPEWVRFKLDISRSLDEILEGWTKRAGKDNLRKIKKHGFVCETAHNFQQLSEFYHQMYLPFIKSRYGSLALISTVGHMKGLLEQGTLLLLRNQSDYIAGNLIYEGTPYPRAAFLAVKDGSTQYLRQGALSALYYHSIIWAKAKGYTLFDFGHCRSILSDGLFRYKRRWGMYIEKSGEKNRMLYLSLKNLTPEMSDFFAANPLVCECGRRLYGLIFCRSADELTPIHLERLRNKYFIRGLEGLKIIMLGKSARG